MTELLHKTSLCKYQLGISHAATANKITSRAEREIGSVLESDTGFCNVEAIKSKSMEVRRTLRKRIYCLSPWSNYEEFPKMYLQSSFRVLMTAHTHTHGHMITFWVLDNWLIFVIIYNIT